jgi:hypothetical protein
MKMSTEFRILVCGGREYNDWGRVRKTLDAALEGARAAGKVVVIIHGNARGADLLADQYAREKSLGVIPFPADWDTHGKRAGFIRNKQMLDEGKPHAVIAFPGGIGTRMMVGLAKRYNIPTKEYF